MKIENKTITDASDDKDIIGGKLIIPDGVEIIGQFAFYEHTKLQTIIIPNSITKIYNYGFMSCNSLIYIDIPNSVTHIGANVFRDCISLETVIIPNSVKCIGKCSFENCPKLTIYGELGSYAERYAQENGIKFKEISTIQEYENKSELKQENQNTSSETQNKQLKITDGYYVDENNNKWSCDKYTEQQAIKNSESLVNCFDCVDCRGCKDCTDCINCEGCNNCFRCHHCNGCVKCEDCVKCTMCIDCLNCIGAIEGNSCKSIDDQIKQLNLFLKDIEKSAEQNQSKFSELEQQNEKLISENDLLLNQLKSQTDELNNIKTELMETKTNKLKFFIQNAVIKDVSLGYEDHGILTCYLTLDFGGRGCSFGGYVFDEYHKATETRKGTAYGMECIIRILKTIGVDKWEKLIGKPVRAKLDGESLGSKIIAIGHFLKDEWFSFEEIFNEFNTLVDKNE